MNNQLVMMSGQFWKITLGQNEKIILISTILGIRSTMTFQDFTRSIVSGRIKIEGI